MRCAGGRSDIQSEGNRNFFNSDFQRCYINTVGGIRPDQRTRYEFSRLNLNSEDRIIFNDRIHAVLQPLPWESQIFKRNCWNAHVAITSEHHARAVARRLTQVGMMWIRISSQHMNWINIFREMGFKLLIEMINFELNLKDISSNEKKFYLTRKATQKDIPELESIARNSFVFDRFHRDSKIPSRLSDAAHAEWIKNAVLGKVADITLVAVSRGVITGFHALKWLNVFGRKVGTTVLIGVSQKFVGRGIGRTLLGEGLRVLKTKRVRQAWVRTEVKNVAANHLYASFGFHESNRFWCLRKINP